MNFPKTKSPTVNPGRDQWVMPSFFHAGSEKKMSKMKAVVQNRYGKPSEVFRVAEIDRPVPGPGEVLVKVHFASVHADVWHMATGIPFVLRMMGAGFRRPCQPVPGTDMSGVVASIGENVANFRVG
ncbi:MAG: hypothetical protein JNM63_09385, partial [Spirochaetia bacterium]|nr:hypothetical protein [Spirochaetia bacterium]